MLSVIRTVDSRTGSCAGWAYPAVISTWLGPVSFPIIGNPPPPRGRKKNRIQVPGNPDPEPPYQLQKYKKIVRVDMSGMDQ